VTKVIDARLAEILEEDIALAPYDRAWLRSFNREREHLHSCLPRPLAGRIEHFGGTAVPGLITRPIIDVLVEVACLEEAKTQIAPLLERQGYEYFWRPPDAHDLPFYAWFVKRNEAGQSTHHIHMVEPHFEQWDRLLFRDYLIEHPRLAAQYGALKLSLATVRPRDLAAYNQGKKEFITRYTERAKQFYSGN
jgi:GrpB-like predicted nucleotidyltransferase (UPF0157 family)